MFDDTLAEVLPAIMCFGISMIRIHWSGGKYIGGAEMGPEALGDHGPAHKLRDGEGLEELFLFGDEGIAGIGVDAVEKV